MSEVRKADTDYLRYMDALRTGLVVPVLPKDFRELPNEQMAYAFGVADAAMMHACANLMRRIDQEASRA